MYALCIDCAEADLLKQLITDFKTLGTCSVCSAAGTKVMPTSEVLFIRAIKALIRYHYSEVEYHSKLGGDSFQSLLSVENPIIRINPALDELEYEDFLLSFLENLDADDEVHVITAYGRDIYNYMPLSAVSLGDTTILPAVQKALAVQNYFVVEADFVNDFAPLVPYVASSIEAGGRWYRARIGAKRRAANYSFPRRATEYFFEPHIGDAISAPPIELAAAGRLNRPGVSFLYLASDEDTAVAEVRPHPGDLVSVGAFSIEVNLEIAELSQHDLKKYFRCDRELDLLEVIVAIENALATAVPPSNRQLYSLTQFLAEIFRRSGFHGLRFKSTVGAGSNLVLFEPTAAKWIEGTSRVVEVHRVLYQHSPRAIFDPETKYDLDFEKRSKQLTSKVKPK